MDGRERAVWTILVVLGITVGATFGLALAVPGFWVDPVTATFAVLATGGLSGVMWARVR